MLRFLNRAKEPWTLGSPVAWVMNCLRANGRIEAFLAKRHIESVRQMTDGQIALRLKGIEGQLNIPREFTVESLFPLLIEQMYQWHWHYYQIPQTRIEANDVVFDCGSAEGLFAFLNRRRAHRIFAFEPLPVFVESLHRTFHNDPSVEIVGSALARKPGTLYVCEAGTSSFLTTEPTGTSASIDSIDNFCANRSVRISYLKADVEGYEMELLDGAADSIRTYKPKIAITTYHKKEHAGEIIAFLRSLNPTYRFLLKGICRPHGNPIMLHAW